MNNVPLPSRDRRLLVVDANVIQGMKHGTSIAPEFDLLVGDVLGMELEGKLRGNDTKALEKFGQWMNENANRIWVAKMIGQLQEEQLRLARPMRRSDVIDVPRSKAFREYACGNSCHWRDLRKYMDPAAPAKEEAWNRETMAVPLEWSQNQGFLRRFNQAASRLDKDHQAAELGNAVRDIDLSEPILCQATSGANRLWLRRTIALAPDRILNVRYARLMLYYHVAGAIRPSTIRNDRDDMQYALLASYTGHLATHDKGLRNCMAALFPRVCIIDPLDEQSP